MTGRTVDTQEGMILTAQVLHGEQTEAVCQWLEPVLGLVGFAYLIALSDGAALAGPARRRFPARA